MVSRIMGDFQAAHHQTGVPDELGIIPCAVDGVFDAINAVSHQC